MIDSRNLDELDAAVKRGAEELLRRAKAAGHNVLVTSTYRDYEMQDYLYAQGRTRPGGVVTNAKAGCSNHNFRLAFDVCKNVKGQEYSDTAFFKAVGKMWGEMGGVWGGTFASIVDLPHFEFTNGLTAAQLRAGAKLPVGIRMKWEAEPAKPSVDETLAALAKRVALDTGYWKGVLEGSTALNPAYLRVIFERVVAMR